MDWKIIYIGSPTNSQHDQIIDAFDMDNLQPGVMNFQTESDPPNFNLIPQEEIVGKNSLIFFRHNSHSHFCLIWKTIILQSWVLCEKLIWRRSITTSSRSPIKWFKKTHFGWKSKNIQILNWMDTQIGSSCSRYTIITTKHSNYGRRFVPNIKRCLTTTRSNELLLRLVWQ